MAFRVVVVILVHFYIAVVQKALSYNVMFDSKNINYEGGQNFIIYFVRDKQVKTLKTVISRVHMLVIRPKHIVGAS